MSGLDPSLQYAAEQLVSLAANYGLSPRVTSVRRSFAQQSKLYFDYLRKSALGVPTLPAAFPGTSKHELGLAFDMICLAGDQYLAPLGAIWKSWGGRWFPSDPVHFEAP